MVKLKGYILIIYTYEIRFYDVILGVLIDDPTILEPDVKIPL